MDSTNNEEQIKLHLGCGNVHIPGYRNIDERYQPGVDFVDNAGLLRRYKENSVDVIYACAILEHFSRHENQGVLKRWCDILKPGGILRVSVPSWEAVVEHYLEHKDLRKLLGFIYAGQDFSNNNHFYIWDFKTLKEDLLNAGFSSVDYYDWRDTEHADIDDFSRSYIPHLDFSAGKLMHLNLEAIK